MSLRFRYIDAEKTNLVLRKIHQQCNITAEDANCMATMYVKAGKKAPLASDIDNILE
jgi:hypothetical protein